MLWILAIAVGLVVALASRGSLGNLAGLRFRWPWLLVVAVGVREVIVFSPLSKLDGAQYAYVVSLGVIVLWTLWHFQRLPGVVLVSIGSLSNLLVVVANGGHMPVAAGIARTQLQGILLVRGTIGQYTLMGPDTHLNQLGDWISLTPLPAGYSPGDILIAIGIAAVIVIGAHRRTESKIGSAEPQDV
jgi:hypothetical protein